jgi:hypothetical protein
MGTLRRAEAEHFAQPDRQRGPELLPGEWGNLRDKFPRLGATTLKRSPSSAQLKNAVCSVLLNFEDLRNWSGGVELALEWNVCATQQE